MSSTLMKTLTAVSMLTVVTSCTTNTSEEASVAAGRQLYISSGLCSSGAGITTFTAQTSSRKVSKLDLSTKALSTVLDFTQSYSGGTFGINTAPASIVDNGSSLFMLVEDSAPTASGERRIYTIPKSSPYNTAVYSNDALALTTTTTNILRNLVKDADGSLLFSKSVAIEKISTNTLRVPQAANPWVNAPAGNCATSITNISAVSLLPTYTGYSSGKILFAHQGATAALSRIGIVSADGYSIAGNCLNGYQLSTTAPTNATNVTGTVTFTATGPTPTAMVYVPTGTGAGKLLVAYGPTIAADMSNTATLSHAIVAWTVTESSGTVATLTSPVVLSNKLDAVFGISAMAYDSVDNSLYVAGPSQIGVANQTTAGYGYKVEKFTYDSTGNTLTLVRGSNNEPFLDRSSATKCINSLVVGSN